MGFAMISTDFVQKNATQRLKMRLCATSATKLVFASIASIASVATFATPAIAGPFVCSGEAYQVQSGQLRSFNPATSTYVDIGTAQGSYNAAGYNQLDNFIYANLSNNLIRIHSDGSTEIVSPMGYFSNSGDVDDSGNLYAMASRSRYGRVNIATGTVTGVNLPTAATDFRDIVFRREGGVPYLIALSSTELSRINLNTDTVENIPITGLPTGFYGALWTDVNGRLLAFHNESGAIYEISNVFSATPTVTFAAVGTPSANNDGMSCPLAPLPSLRPLAEDDSFTTPFETALTQNVLADNGNGADTDPEGGALTVATTPVTGPTNGTVTIAANGNFTYTPNAGFFGTDSFVYRVADPTGVTTDATVTITVPAPPVDLVTVKTRTSATATPLETDTVTFRIVVTNNSSFIATNVSLTDLLPAGLTATAANGTVTAGTYDSATGLWTIPSLANGASATLTIQGTVDLGQGNNVIANTIPAAADADQPDPTTIGDDLTESVTVKGGSVGTGTINYANSGNGVNRGSIGWLDWSGSSLEDGIQNGDVVNFTLPTCRSGTLTATFSNASLADAFRVTDMANLGGTTTAAAYNSPGLGEKIYNLTGVEGTRRFSIEWQYVEDGVTIPPNIFVIDADRSSSAEYVRATTTGSNWVFIENAGSATYDLTGLGSQTFTLRSTGSGVPLLLTMGTSQLDFEILSRLPNSRAGIAMGVLMPCDYGDAPASAGAPAHKFQQVPVGSTLTPRADQLQIGTAIDADTGPQHSAAADGDDALGPNADDEDGVVLSGLRTTETGTIAVNVTDPTAGLGLLQAWIDWNGDGAFGAGEQIATDLVDGSAQDASALSGVIGITVPVPATAMVGNRLVRLRYSTTTGLNATAIARDGEVEDHIVVITQPQANLALTKTNTPGVNSEVDQVSDAVITGSTTSYTITVTNNGPDLVTGALVTDVIGSGLTCPASNAVTLAGDGVPAGTFTIGDLTGAGITLGTLNDGQSITLTYSCGVN